MVGIGQRYYLINIAQILSENRWIFVGLHYVSSGNSQKNSGKNLKNIGQRTYVMQESVKQYKI